MIRLLLVFCLLSSIAARSRAASPTIYSLTNGAMSLGLRVTPDGGISIVSLKSVSTHDWVSGIANPTPIPLVAYVEIGGQIAPVVWRLADTSRSLDADKTRKRLTFVFKCDSPRLELRSEWRASEGFGPIEHSITMHNLTDQTLLLPLQTSLVFDCLAPASHILEQWWVEKGSYTPSAEGTHHVSLGPDPVDRSLLSTPYSEDSSRDIIPWMAIQDNAAGIGVYTGIEFSGRVRQRVTTEATAKGTGTTHIELGLTPEPEGSAPYKTRLTPGETFTTPTVFVGCYRGDVEDGANHLRRWVEKTLRPAVHDPLNPRLVVNSWGGGMAIDEHLAGKMIDDAADLGLEMFHIDAGWFRGVGDWRPNPAKFPSGLAPVAERAHAKGLKFGLWVGWTQGGISPDAEDRQAVLNVHSDRKGWFTHDYPADWKPADFTGGDLCLSQPQAADWCHSLLDRLVSEYHLDLLEHDQRMIVDACSRTDHPHTGSRTDVAYRATNGYYSVYDRLRAKHPDLLFEDCVNGGRTVDYGIVQRVHYISITDTYDPLSNRRAFYDASYALPPSMCECYIENTQPKTDSEFKTMLRSGMMGWCTIMCDTNAWSAAHHAIAKRQFELYKTTLRPMIKEGNLYHVSQRPDGKRWDGIQYASTDQSSAVLFAFRGAEGDQAHTFRLRGLDPKANYSVTLEDGAASIAKVTGRELMQKGLSVAISERGGSEIVTLRSSK